MRFVLPLFVVGCGGLASPYEQMPGAGVPTPVPGGGTASGAAGGAPGGVPTGTAGGNAGGTTSSVVRRSCLAYLEADAAASSGVYTIEPQQGSGTQVEVYCDMATDGGGWTLVGSSLFPLQDAATAWHSDLETTAPSGATLGVWDGLRPYVIGTGGRSDFRVACSQAAGGAFAVDLSFYDTIWYAEVTQGTDADSCFSEIGQPDLPPARRNNLSGESLPAGDPWNAGALVGEDLCDDLEDFTVDFDDRGMDSFEADGTDWGSDDGLDKCGSGFGIGFFLFVREL